MLNFDYKKSLGQNFLNDENIINKIVNFAKSNIIFLLSNLISSIIVVKKVKRRLNKLMTNTNKNTTIAIPKIVANSESITCLRLYSWRTLIPLSSNANAHIRQATLIMLRKAASSAPNT